jgi:hypothetical protein
MDEDHLGGVRAPAWNAVADWLPTSFGPASLTAAAVTAQNAGQAIAQLQQGFFAADGPDASVARGSLGGPIIAAAELVSALVVKAVKLLITVMLAILVIQLLVFGPLGAGAVKIAGLIVEQLVWQGISTVLGG